jgi:hypothetical protein
MRAYQERDAGTATPLFLEYGQASKTGRYTNQLSEEWGLGYL